MAGEAVAEEASASAESGRPAGRKGLFSRPLFGNLFRRGEPEGRARCREGCDVRPTVAARPRRPAGVADSSRDCKVCESSPHVHLQIVPTDDAKAAVPTGSGRSATESRPAAAAPRLVVAQDPNLGTISGPHVLLRKPASAGAAKAPPPPITAPVVLPAPNSLDLAAVNVLPDKGEKAAAAAPTPTRPAILGQKMAEGLGETQAAPTTLAVSSSNRATVTSAPTHPKSTSGGEASVERVTQGPIILPDGPVRPEARKVNTADFVSPQVERGGAAAAVEENEIEPRRGSWLDSPARRGARRISIPKHLELPERPPAPIPASVKNKYSTDYENH